MPMREDPSGLAAVSLLRKDPAGTRTGRITACTYPNSRPTQLNTREPPEIPDVDGAKMSEFQLYSPLPPTKRTMVG